MVKNKLEVVCEVIGVNVFDDVVEIKLQFKGGDLYSGIEQQKESTFDILNPSKDFFKEVLKTGFEIMHGMKLQQPDIILRLPKMEYQKMGSPTVGDKITAKFWRNKTVG